MSSSASSRQKKKTGGRRDQSPVAAATTVPQQSVVTPMKLKPISVAFSTPQTQPRSSAANSSFSANSPASFAKTPQPSMVRSHASLSTAAEFSSTSPSPTVLLGGGNSALHRQNALSAMVLLRSVKKVPQMAESEQQQQAEEWAGRHKRLRTGIAPQSSSQAESAFTRNEEKRCSGDADDALAAAAALQIKKESSSAGSSSATTTGGSYTQAVFASLKRVSQKRGADVVLASPSAPRTLSPSNEFGNDDDYDDLMVISSNKTMPDHDYSGRISMDHSASPLSLTSKMLSTRAAREQLHALGLLDSTCSPVHAAATHRKDDGDVESDHSGRRDEGDSAPAGDGHTDGSVRRRMLADVRGAVIRAALRRGGIRGGLSSSSFSAVVEHPRQVHHHSSSRALRASYDVAASKKKQKDSTGGSRKRHRVASSSTSFYYTPPPIRHHEASEFAPPVDPRLSEPLFTMSRRKKKQKNKKTKANADTPTASRSSSADESTSESSRHSSSRCSSTSTAATDEELCDNPDAEARRRQQRQKRRGRGGGGGARLSGKGNKRSNREPKKADDDIYVPLRHRNRLDRRVEELLLLRQRQAEACDEHQRAEALEASAFASVPTTDDADDYDVVEKKERRAAESESDGEVYERPTHVLNNASSPPAPVPASYGGEALIRVGDGIDGVDRRKVGFHQNGQPSAELQQAATDATAATLEVKEDPWHMTELNKNGRMKKKKQNMNQGKDVANNVNGGFDLDDGDDSDDDDDGSSVVSDAVRRRQRAMRQILHPMPVAAPTTTASASPGTMATATGSSNNAKMMMTAMAVSVSKKHQPTTSASSADVVLPVGAPAADAAAVSLAPLPHDQQHLQQSESAARAQQRRYPSDDGWDEDNHRSTNNHGAALLVDPASLHGGVGSMAGHSNAGGSRGLQLLPPIRSISRSSQQQQQQQQRNGEEQHQKPMGPSSRNLVTTTKAKAKASSEEESATKLILSQKKPRSSLPPRGTQRAEPQLTHSQQQADDEPRKTTKATTQVAVEAPAPAAAQLANLSVGPWPSSSSSSSARQQLVQQQRAVKAEAGVVGDGVTSCSTSSAGAAAALITTTAAKKGAAAKDSAGTTKKTQQQPPRRTRSTVDDKKKELVEPSIASATTPMSASAAEEPETETEGSTEQQQNAEPLLTTAATDVVAANTQSPTKKPMTKQEAALQKLEHMTSSAASCAVDGDNRGNGRPAEQQTSAADRSSKSLELVGGGRNTTTRIKKSSLSVVASATAAGNNKKKKGATAAAATTVSGAAQSPASSSPLTTGGEETAVVAESARKKSSSSSSVSASSADVKAAAAATAASRKKKEAEEKAAAAAEAKAKLQFTGFTLADAVKLARNAKYCPPLDNLTAKKAGRLQRMAEQDIEDEALFAKENPNLVAARAKVRQQYKKMTAVIAVCSSFSDEKVEPIPQTAIQDAKALAHMLQLLGYHVTTLLGSKSKSTSSASSSSFSSLEPSKEALMKIITDTVAISGYPPDEAITGFAAGAGRKEFEDSKKNQAQSAPPNGICLVYIISRGALGKLHGLDGESFFMLHADSRVASLSRHNTLLIDEITALRNAATNVQPTVVAEILPLNAPIKGVSDINLGTRFAVVRSGHKTHGGDLTLRYPSRTSRSGNSAFSWYLLKALQGDAVRNRGGGMTMSAINAFISSSCEKHFEKMIREQRVDAAGDAEVLKAIETDASQLSIKKDHGAEMVQKGDGMFKFKQELDARKKQELLDYCIFEVTMRVDVGYCSRPGFFRKALMQQLEALLYGKAKYSSRKTLKLRQLYRTGDYFLFLDPTTTTNLAEVMCDGGDADEDIFSMLLGGVSNHSELYANEEYHSEIRDLQDRGMTFQLYPSSSMVEIRTQHRKSAQHDISFGMFEAYYNKNIQKFRGRTIKQCQEELVLVFSGCDRDFLEMVKMSALGRLSLRQLYNANVVGVDFHHYPPMRRMRTVAMLAVSTAALANGSTTTSIAAVAKGEQQQQQQPEKVGVSATNGQCEESPLELGEVVSSASFAVAPVSSASDKKEAPSKKKEEDSNEEDSSNEKGGGRGRRGKKGSGAGRRESSRSASPSSVPIAASSPAASPVALLDLTLPPGFSVTHTEDTVMRRYNNIARFQSKIRLKHFSKRQEGRIDCLRLAVRTLNKEYEAGAAGLVGLIEIKEIERAARRLMIEDHETTRRADMLEAWDIGFSDVCELKMRVLPSHHRHIAKLISIESSIELIPQEEAFERRLFFLWGIAVNQLLFGTVTLSALEEEKRQRTANIEGADRQKIKTYYENSWFQLKQRGAVAR